MEDAMENVKTVEKNNDNVGKIIDLRLEIEKRRDNMRKTDDHRFMEDSSGRIVAAVGNVVDTNMKTDNLGRVEVELDYDTLDLGENRSTATFENESLNIYFTLDLSNKDMGKILFHVMSGNKAVVDCHKSRKIAVVGINQ